MFILQQKIIEERRSREGATMMRRTDDDDIVELVLKKMHQQRQQPSEQNSIDGETAGSSEDSKEIMNESPFTLEEVLTIDVSTGSEDTIGGSSSTDSTCSNSKITAIQINDNVEVFEIECDYSPVEISNMWFTKEEYSTFSKQCDEEAQRVEYRIKQGGIKKKIHDRQRRHRQAQRKHEQIQQQQQQENFTTDDGIVDVDVDDMIENSIVEKTTNHYRQLRHQQEAQQNQIVQQLQRDNLTTVDGIIEEDSTNENSEVDKIIIHARQRRQQEAQQKQTHQQQQQQEKASTDDGIVEVDHIFENSDVDNVISHARKRRHHQAQQKQKQIQQQQHDGIVPVIDYTNVDKIIIHARQRRRQQAELQKKILQQLQGESNTVGGMIEDSNVDNIITGVVNDKNNEKYSVEEEEEDDDDHEGDDLAGDNEFDNDNDDECCPLGLEAWSVKGYKTRQRNQKNAIDSVLDEQFSSWDRGILGCPDAIASLYFSASEASKKVASMKAIELEADVEQHLLESTLKEYTDAVHAYNILQHSFRSIKSGSNSKAIPILHSALEVQKVKSCNDNDNDVDDDDDTSFILDADVDNSNDDSCNSISSFASGDSFHSEPTSFRQLHPISKHILLPMVKVPLPSSFFSSSSPSSSSPSSSSAKPTTGKSPRRTKNKMNDDVTNDRPQTPKRVGVDNKIKVLEATTTILHNCIPTPPLSEKEKNASKSPSGLQKPKSVRHKLVAAKKVQRPPSPPPKPRGGNNQLAKLRAKSPRRGRRGVIATATATATTPTSKRKNEENMMIPKLSIHSECTTSTSSLSTFSLSTSSFNTEGVNSSKSKKATDTKKSATTSNATTTPRGKNKKHVKNSTVAITSSNGGGLFLSELRLPLLLCGRRK
jgi:hypothetical protein